MKTSAESGLRLDRGWQDHLRCCGTQDDRHAALSQNGYGADKEEKSSAAFIRPQSYVPR